ncbi:YsnF/AvaK domain-containing protein, partial [Streptomyces tendae]
AGGTAGTAGGTAGRQDAMEREAMRGDQAMTRSEEQMHIGVERHESGRARLRKYVVTEEVQQTVPVTHEEVRVVREPITDANRDEAMAGPEISEAEHEVTLHAERPVVETETVPVERVRMTTEELTENETVRGQVRKERIEAETESFTEDEMRQGGKRRGRE